mgnify:FL=1
MRKFIEKERVLWYLRRGGVYFEDVNGEKEMSIVYIDTKNYTSNDLQELFQSVGWLSANYPERLKKALGNSETVFTVWDGEKLVGLVNAIDDSELTAYVHYLCVNPEYQGQGIGKNLLQRIKEKYKNYLYIILIAENKELVKYYSKNGFEYVDGRYVFVVQNEQLCWRIDCFEYGKVKKMTFEQIYEPQMKETVVRKILEALPDWFEMEEGREQYIKESAEQICIGAAKDTEFVGFLCLKETGKDTLELAVMGVLKEYHRQGIGRGMFMMAKNIAREKGYSFLQVKTVQMGKYEEYDDTNRFYIRLGFKEFEVFPTLWDEANPCQIYVMSVER